MSISFRQAKFLTSAFELSQLVPDDGAEVAFAGRSNAGKSSAINCLTRQKGLCKTSKTPGRTQLINFFELSDGQIRLVDLPGYGYAKVPMSIKDHWQRHLDNYLRSRECLRGMVLLVDIRHPFKPFDEMMIDWCAESGLALHVLLTKADKLKRGAQQNAVLAAKRQLADSGATVQAFSATKKTGVDEFETRLMEWIS